MSTLLIAGFAIGGICVAVAQQVVIAAFRARSGHKPDGGLSCTHHSTRTIVSTWVGRCSRCGQQLGPPFVVIAPVTAVLLTATCYCVHPWPLLAAATWLAIWAVPLAFIDARDHRLPDILTGPAYAGVMVALILAAATVNAWASMVRATLGGAILAGCYLAAALIKPGEMGLGDAKVAASAGSLMAWFSWEAVLAGTAASLVMAAGYGLVLLAARRATLKTHIAYGPALVAGTFLTVMLVSRGHTH
jgi:leader peptidase (prepilin peptidase) / N-methyltransferase